MSGRATTPRWDIAGTCTIEGRRGLILVEAKAHASELGDEGSRVGNEKNSRSIRAAIQQANDGLNQVSAGWGLTAGSHYQLCNRFAWSWKVASLGIPVVLVYLGFLDALDMAERGLQPFDTAFEWEMLVREHADGIVPDTVWNSRLEINGTPMYALTRAMDLQWETIG